MTAALAEQEWTAREAAHFRRIRAWTGPHRARQAAGRTHPILDFLFTYYPHRPSLLERWHPGTTHLLAGTAARRFLSRPGYRQYGELVGLDPVAFTESRRRTARFIHGLLTATAERPARLNCFGMHEWAMVYRTEDVRHTALPLRLGRQHTDDLVERLPIRCSHADAFRFFSAPARPLNSHQPTREQQVELEQPGCLHANMDLYKWAAKLAPFVTAELTADCFELAAEIRILDMRAGPYDLSAYGYSAVPIETTEGRAHYAAEQAAFARRAAPLRSALIEACESLLHWSSAQP
ncbi:hypothetical protein EV191_107100 [Tamaricihabitans halophyticus]|uniref:3-methyladenine DNA glycosylase n=1 Tax=Tamaricihabitans halophyticus TaxID=1262583 RepID=A0A4V2STI3_9PSEU|nr:3-methyladenine DNA glycosylase [Tamaricihabitans halophyticus]TCP50836.1 hypothetical protein EV191_107100 [Tamaricihabitans halophyticus]